MEKPNDSQTFKQTLMFKKLDAYIIKKLLTTFVLSIAIIMAIIIVIDYSEKIDDFTETEAPLSAIAMYYLLLIPYYSNMFAALFCFISVLLVASKLGSNTEIVAMLSCGISFRRILVPFMIAAGLVASVSIFMNMYLLPVANSHRLHYETEYIGNSNTRFIDNTSMYHAQLSKEQFVYVRYYDRDKDKANDLTLEQIDTNQRLVSKLTADYADWNPETQKWDLFVWTSRDYLPDGSEIVKSGYKRDTTINMLPKHFKMRKGTVGTMKYDELSEFIEKEKLAGSNNLNLYYIEKYKRIAFPMSTFVLTLIGASLASRKVRGGIGVHIAFGILLAFTYILFMQLTTEFSVKGGVDPLLATWVSNFIYLIIGFILYRKAPK